MGAHDFKLNKVPLFALKSRKLALVLASRYYCDGASFSSKISEYQCFAVCCPETSSCVSKPLLLQCKLVRPQCLCQVSLALKEVQIGAHDFKLYNVPFLLENR